MKKVVVAIFVLLLISVIAINIGVLNKQRNQSNSKNDDPTDVETSSIEYTSAEVVETDLVNETADAAYNIENFIKRYKGNLCEVKVDDKVYIPKCPLNKYIVSETEKGKDADELIRMFFYDMEYQKIEGIYDMYESENEFIEKHLNYSGNSHLTFYIRYKSELDSAEDFYDRISQEEAAATCRDVLQQLGVNTWDEYEGGKSFSELNNIPVYSFRFWGRCGDIRISHRSYRTGDPVQDLIDGENLLVNYGPEGVCYIGIMMHREPVMVDGEYSWNELLTPNEACQALVEEIDTYNGMIKSKTYTKIELVYLPGSEPGDKQIGKRFIPFWELTSKDGTVDLVDAVTGYAFVH